MSYHARTIPPPGASGKRKEIESCHQLKPSAKPQQQSQADWCNGLLAGYMAHEFLTKGTLFGEKFDPARAEAVPVGREWKRGRETAEAGEKREQRSYGEVARLLKRDGAHIPGIINPTQLGWWIQM